MDVAPFQPVDRISNLPDNVMDDILMRLSIRDAAKTSILATQWHHKWQNLPQLNFDSTLWPKSLSNRELARLKFAQILYRVLLCHQGPITKFSLDVPDFKGPQEIDPLIYILWKSNVEELALKNTGPPEEYTLSSTVFRCLQLKYLSLACCTINPPPSFKGFTRLIRLDLQFVIVGAERLANLISCCPLLEQLVLNTFIKLGRLEIDAPRLKRFDLTCIEASICFTKSPLLEIVSVAADNNAEFGDHILNVVEFFNSVPALQELHIGGSLVTLLDEAEVQAKMATCFENLKTLKLLDIAINYREELSAVLFLIRSSSNLEKLKIQINLFVREADHMFLEEQDFSNVVLHHLQEVILEEFQGTSSEMILIKLLLEKAPTLKRMVILSRLGEFDGKLVRPLKELNEFLRASQDARVIFKNNIK